MSKAKSGYDYEIACTKRLNLGVEFWKDLPIDKKGVYAIRITSNKYSMISEKKEPPKADIFLAKGSVPVDYLKKSEFYLCEADLHRLGLSPIVKSGISVKKPYSEWTIHKISPNNFKKIFGDNILAAGASIYCRQNKDFYKNSQILSGWGIKEAYFFTFFKEATRFVGGVCLQNKDFLEKVKKYSNKEIVRVVKGSKKISDIIFKGLGNFDEPYTANYIIEDGKIKKNDYRDFVVTTGNGRSKGVYTVMFKPVN